MPLASKRIASNKARSLLLNSIYLSFCMFFSQQTSRRDISRQLLAFYTRRNHHNGPSYVLDVPTVTTDDIMEHYVATLNNGESSAPLGGNNGLSANDDKCHSQLASPPGICAYADCVSDPRGYQWLSETLRAKIKHRPSVLDARRQIRNVVIKTLRDVRSKNILSMSETQPIKPQRIALEIDWDPKSFVVEQQYDLTPEDAIANAITVTGSPKDCQALTTSQYLTQTWASTGDSMIRLIRCVLGGKPGERHSGKFQFLQLHKKTRAILLPGLEFPLRPHHLSCCYLNLSLTSWCDSHLARRCDHCHSMAKWSQVSGRRIWPGCVPCGDCGGACMAGGRSSVVP